MLIQCSNCMDHLWEWMRLPTGDILTCRECGTPFTVIGLDGHAMHITTQAPKTIGQPDTLDNLSVNELDETHPAYQPPYSGE